MFKQYILDSTFSNKTKPDRPGYANFLTRGANLSFNICSGARLAADGEKYHRISRQL